MIFNLQNSLNPLYNCTNLIKHSKKFEYLKPLKSLIIVSGLTDHKHVISEFVAQCFDLGTPEFALTTFYASNNRSLLVQNLLVKRLCNLGLFQDVISVYKSCRLSGCVGSDYTFPYMIKACTALCDVELGREIHCVVIRNGYDRNVVVQTGFVDFYAKIGRMDVARLVFDRMSERDVVCWNALIKGYSFNGFDEEALGVLDGMWRKGVRANVGTLACVVPVCNRLGFMNLGRSLHGYAVKSGFDQDELLTPAFVSLYASDGDIGTARCLFEFSPKKNVVIWNSVIYAYTQNQKPEQAFEMFSQMVRAGLRPNMVSFVSIIPCCEGMYSLSHGECFYGYAMKYGLDNQVPVVTAIMSMYAKLGDIDTARILFTEMPHKNLLMWNSIISGHVHLGLWHSSLEGHREMELAGFEADSVSIINVLSACSELQELLLGKSAHAISIRKGFDLNLNILNLLLAFYSNCHQLDSSFKLFDRMVHKNSISWNTMISSCVYNGERQKAASLLWEMQQTGMQLDVVSLISVLPCCSDNCDLSQGMGLHAFSVKSGFISDFRLANALITMYSTCGYLDAATLLFNTMMQRCLVSWNSLLTGYRCHKLHKEGLFLFKQMMNDGQKPNYITLLNVLPACCTLLQGKSIHSYAIRTGSVLQTPLVTSLISMYSIFKNMDSCYSLFEDGDKLDISLWNVMLSVLEEGREVEKVFTLFRKLHQTKLQVDFITVLSVVSSCVLLNSISAANSILTFVIRNGFFNETSICNALMDLYAKCGDILMAREVFDNLLDKDAVSWSVMINGYGLHGDGDAAISLLSQMENSGIEPDSVTYLNILSACSHAGLSEQSKSLINSMLKRGIQPTVQHYACVADLLGRTGQLHEAYDIVKRLPGGPTVCILESLLGACRVYGNYELGEKVGELVIEKDPENSAAYVALYNLYAGAGRWQDANRMRKAMEVGQLRKVPAFSMLEGETL